MIITVDGPAASGKSSICRELALKMSIPWVSTGIFYRGIAWAALRENVDLDQESKLVDLINNGDWEVKLTPEQTRFIYAGYDATKELHFPETGSAASQISQLAKVRASLLNSQRELSNSHKFLIAEGRDCGTIVFPNAEFKFYITASEEIRASRRALESGKDKKDIKSQQAERDLRDRTRKIAPLKMAEDGIKIDTTNISIQEAVELMRSKIGEKTS